jgi:hypothetical protein
LISFAKDSLRFGFALHDSLCVLLAIYRLPKHDPQYLVGQLCHTAGRLSNEGGSNDKIICQFHGTKARVKKFSPRFGKGWSSDDRIASLTSKHPGHFIKAWWIEMMIVGDYRVYKG